jgi:hypothetical protein
VLQVGDLPARDGDGVRVRPLDDPVLHAIERLVLHRRAVRVGDRVDVAVDLALLLLREVVLGREVITQVVDEILEVDAV